MIDGIPNPSRTWKRVGLVMLLAGLAAAVVPFLVGGAYALLMVGLLVAAVGGTIAGLMSGRARVVDRMVSGTDLVAHWRYAPGEWQAWAGEELSETAGAMKGGVILIGVMALVIGGVVALADPDAAPAMGVMVLGLVGLLSLVALIAFRGQKSRARLDGQVLVSKTGIWMNGELHDWTTFGSRLERVEIRTDEKSRRVFTVTYSIRSKSGRSQVGCEALIPAAVGDAAYSAVDVLQALIDQRQG